MADVSVPLRSKRQRRALAMQKINHAIPAVGLFFAGQQAIIEGHSGFGFFLGIFEIISSAVLIVLFAKELRAAMRPQPPSQASHAAHHGVDWVDIAAGFVLVAEALERWHLTHHIPRPTILTAFVTFALGLFHGRLVEWRSKRRVLRVTGDGLSIAGRKFTRKLHGTWADLESIEIGDRWAAVKTRAGRVRRLDFADLEGAADVRAALLEARRRLDCHRSSADQVLVARTAE